MQQGCPVLPAVQVNFHKIGQATNQQRGDLSLEVCNQTSVKITFIIKKSKIMMIKFVNWQHFVLPGLFSYQNLCFVFEAIIHFLKVGRFCVDLCAFVHTTGV